jgi:RNA polymerase sigma-70 factor (ECF subfamily)
VARADLQVLRTLHEDHAGAVYAYAARATGDRELAKDVVQEVLLRAWQHPEALDPARGPVRGWLITLARNVIVDEWRRRKARPPEVALEPVIELEAGGSELDRAVEGWHMEEALRRLSPEHRGVLREVYYRDRSVAEAARALGVPPGTVKSRTYYALRALRLVLAEMGRTL